ncbi:hypothetical protein D5086_005970 [Populus alba]|uniref:Uncharacterized protein n=1 Tax=Populus alba TaxID=43335 RepID=A0ACC4CJD1_POPAL
MVNRLKVTFVITKFISKSRQLGSSIGPIQLDTISDGYDDGFNQAAAFFTHACAVDYIFYNVYHEVLKMPVSSTLVLIEGLPLLLELQDLPTFFVLPDSYPANVKMTMSQFANLDKADWILINTFYKLECEVVDTMSKVCPLLTIGPTIPSIYLDKSIDDEDDYGISLCEIDASLSINWLSTKPTASVVYVSFGSCATLSNKQIFTSCGW